MPPGKRYGGRVKGTPNKNSQVLIDAADRLGVNPFEILLLFAKGDWQALGYESKYVQKFSPAGQAYDVDVIEAELRVRAASEAAQYLYPKRKAMEVTGAEGKDLFQNFNDIVMQVYNEKKK